MVLLGLLTSAGDIEHVVLALPHALGLLPLGPTLYVE